ncbi:uncharacterized protein sunn isoform X2 [Eurosta solidaginis]|uniref:uncharacterized protein sunn isoform X2 n=1 Tax=Eurosta solidaginis TaxID=178769 RepID=UPI0035312002
MQRWVPCNFIVQNGGIILSKLVFFYNCIMNFVASLKCGTTPEVEATRCIQQLLNRSDDQSNICSTFASELINELFKAIGLQTKITVEQLEAGKGFDWDAAGCGYYIFHCNIVFFRAFERFLKQLCLTVLDEQREFDITATDCFPIMRLIQILAVWCNCYMDLLEQDVIQVQYLQEPLARINYSLFFGLHKIRKQYGSTIQQLDELCTVLLNSALDGLFFKECHDYIVEGLLALVEKDFGVCDAFTKDAFKFFYQAFCVEQQKTTQCNIFKCFTHMLTNLAALQDTNAHRTFVCFLIAKQMQEIYYTTLKLENTKRLLLATLRFLHNLQEKLLDLNCFSQTFLEAILAHVLHTDTSISQMAAELYITMARRKANADDTLLKHILEYYFEEMNIIDSLPYYIDALWPNFTYMQYIQIYFDLIKDEDVPLTMRYFVAQFVVVIYRKMVAHTEKHAPEIMQVFKILPEILTLLSSQCLKGILLQLYSVSELSLVRNIRIELLVDFENFFVSEIKNNLQYPYMLNLFMQFLRFIEETKNFAKLEKYAKHIYREYEEIERTLHGLPQGKLPNHAQAISYGNILKKLCVLLQGDYNVFDNFDRIVRTLSARIIDNQQLNEIANKRGCFIDIYAIELLVNGCIKLCINKDLTKSTRQWLINQVSVLESYLLNALSNADVKTNAQMNRLKTYFICLVNLYCTFHNSCGFCKLPLALRSYHILVETLVISCLHRKAISAAAISHTVNEENLELHPHYITQYQRFMFRKFSQLHSSKHIVLPSRAAWKICLHYGLKSHKFNKELLAFMEALATHHFKTFTYILAALVYNLYKQKPPFKMDEIQKSFIDQLPSRLTPSILCANVVLQVLELLKESLQKLPPTTGNNRLLALKHLNQFTQNLNVNSDNVLPAIQNLAKALQNHILNTAEQMSLNAYLNDLGMPTKN